MLKLLKSNTKNGKLLYYFGIYMRQSFTLKTSPKPPSPSFLSPEKLLVANLILLSLYFKDSMASMSLESAKPIYIYLLNFCLQLKTHTICILSTTDQQISINIFVFTHKIKILKWNIALFILVHVYVQLRIYIIKR